MRRVKFFSMKARNVTIWRIGSSGIQLIQLAAIVPDRLQKRGAILRALNAQ